MRDKMEDARVITALDAWDPSWREIDQGGLVPMMRAAIAAAESTPAPADPSRVPADPSRAIAEALATERDRIERIAYKVLRRDLADDLMAEVRKVSR
jgi:hypothetical protein